MTAREQYRKARRRLLEANRRLGGYDGPTVHPGIAVARAEMLAAERRLKREGTL